jgi:thiol-disulfide isomerase/thioredoxin
LETDIDRIKKDKKLYQSYYYNISVNDSMILMVQKKIVECESHVQNGMLTINELPNNLNNSQSINTSEIYSDSGNETDCSSCTDVDQIELDSEEENILNDLDPLRNDFETTMNSESINTDLENINNNNSNKNSGNDMVQIMKFYNNRVEQEKKDIIKKADNLCSHQQLNKDAITVLLFHAPWCGYSQKIYPIWNELCPQYSNKNVNMIHINGDDEKYKNLMKNPRLDIKGYPTICLLNKGDVHKFSDLRKPSTVENISAFIDSYLN